ncbi:MAG: hypothetical protein A3F12_00590 [Gammaproteobacteria bacterium RIFCSPHIGHO2_12_FULL_38_14]|nr:MAG: hypothetical protein A3F12_00590 [Gammaproteobacteria bacterium RIFCSPHIGHO2_12_FULL_38_14]
MTISKDDWQRVIIPPDFIVIAAIEKINQEALGVLLVGDISGQLLGVITDGDIRRHLLRHGNLDEPVDRIMNRSPISATEDASKEQLLGLLNEHEILHLPILSQDRKIIGLETLKHLTEKKKRHNAVVFMAGGLGTRLHPLTLECPKPLLEIGNKPILEILLENFIHYGFYNFYISVNYKAPMIQEYFQHGEKWGVDIQYIEENEASGTAGSLRLLPKNIDLPFFVVNADIITNINFEQVLDYHMYHLGNPVATVCVRQYQRTIPYGVINIDKQKHHLLSIEEKPTQRFFVNAGIYILKPEALKIIPEDEGSYDMPTLLTDLTKKNRFVGTFPIREYWLDVGSRENLSQAEIDYEKVFV